MEQIYISEILIDRSSLTEETYPFFAIIERFKEKSSISKKITFSPEAIISKRNDFKLRPGDKIIFLSKKDIQSSVDIIKMSDQNTNISKFVLENLTWTILAQ